MATLCAKIHNISCGISMYNRDFSVQSSFHEYLTYIVDRLVLSCRVINSIHLIENNNFLFQINNLNFGDSIDFVSDENYISFCKLFNLD